MSDRTGTHHQAAARHEMAAENHDRAAAFWDSMGDPSRATLQREMAIHERAGAELENRWANLSEHGPGHVEPRGAAQVAEHMRQGATRTSHLLGELADSLERSARLADEHGQRQEEDGRSNEAAKERDAAKRARDIAAHARSQAEGWLELANEGMPRKG